MPRSAGYPIRAAARITGIPVDTLRAWERRYAAVVPARTDRGRAYSQQQIERLQQLASLVQAGHAIGSIAGLSDNALRRLQAGQQRAVPQAAPNAVADLAPLHRAIARYDLDAIESTLARHAMVLRPHELIFGIILPALRDVGARWEAGAICAAQEHLFSGVVRSVLGSLLRSLPRRGDSSNVLFAAPPGERHELGSLCGAVLAAWAGYEVTYLGADLPAADIARAAKATSARLVVLSATASNVITHMDVRPLKRLPSSVAIWAGGACGESMRTAIGTRVRYVESLEQLRELLDRKVA